MTADAVPSGSGDFDNAASLLRFCQQKSSKKFLLWKELGDGFCQNAHCGKSETI